MFPGGFPPVCAEISGAELRMSYGDPSQPILVLAAIRISDVLRSRTTAGDADPI
jgi:hypothetical protein